MKNYLFAAAFVLLAACGNNHFIADKAYRERVHSDFEARKELASARDSALFSVFEGELSAEQREALEFLYAYMPLSDLADYDGDYFLRQVDGALRARDYFAWGKSVPEDIFRHFVLVYRVNNENLDEARDVFFDELKGRLEGLSMYDAALEVNHWCHEKVTYRGSDARTSSSLATMRTSWGRCGEESTFTVSALRAVGIPARQSYTPRWVHTDSNHAWVELWVDGKWYYMGACEPEPQLNVAWFDGPVQRAMMTHTTVFGPYNGPEQKNVETDLYSTINTLSVYAPVRRASVQVVDQAGAPVEGATVQFKVYNGAELFPLVTLKSDAGGRASIDTGRGDVMMWASLGDRYGYTKSTADDAEVKVVLDRTPGETYDETYTMMAPPEQPFNELPADVIAANAVRLAREDSIRNAYMATFAPPIYNRTEPQRWITQAQGNWREIKQFIDNHADDPDLDKFMNSLTAKDLRDTPAAVLEEFIPVNPRIGVEFIRPWRTLLASDRTVDEIIRYIVDNITINDTDNYLNCRLSPRGVHELKVADVGSRDIYFVALCRAANIDARLDPATSKPQYLADGQWRNVSFDTAQTLASAQVKLTLQGDEANIVNPIYGTHFSVARFEDGDFRTLNLRVRSFPAVVDVDPGYYRIMTASRANDGSAEIHTQYLTIGLDGAAATIKLPELEGKIFVKGIVDMNSVIITDSGEKTSLKPLSRGRGAIVVFADPDKEPTKHILQEMPASREALEAWGGAVVFMVPDDKRPRNFDPSQFPGLPSQTVWAADTGRELLNNTAGALQMQFQNNFPLVVYMTNNGGVLFSSEGYRIGIPEDILRTIKLEEATKEN